MPAGMTDIKGVLAVRIIALMTDAYGGKGGIAQYNRDLLRALASHKTVSNIYVLQRTGHKQADSEKIEVSALCSSKYSYVWRAIALTRQCQPDWILCGHINMLPLAILLKKIYQIPVWLQIHGIDAWQAPSSFQQKLSHQIDLVTSVSRFTRQQYLSWSRANRVVVIPNTVSCQKETNTRSEIRKRLQLDEFNVILTVGRLSSSERYKGQDRVINCLPELAKKVPNIKYAIAGDGDDMPRLKSLVTRLSMEKHVEFLGYIADEELPELYTAADLFAMPSTGEGFGIVFLEAMASGTMALGLDSDGSVDPLQDGELGIVSNEQSLCQDIEKALQQERQTDLASRVESIFGHAAYDQQVRALVENHLAPLAHNEKKGNQICVE